MNYTGPTTEIKEKNESLLYTWGGEHPIEQQEDRQQQKP